MTEAFLVYGLTVAFLLVYSVIRGLHAKQGGKRRASHIDGDEGVEE